MNNQPTFAPKVSKEAYWIELRYFKGLHTNEETTFDIWLRNQWSVMFFGRFFFRLFDAFGIGSGCWVGHSLERNSVSFIDGKMAMKANSIINGPTWQPLFDMGHQDFQVTSVLPDPESRFRVQCFQSQVKWLQCYQSQSQDKVKEDFLHGWTLTWCCKLSSKSSNVCFWISYTNVIKEDNRITNHNMLT